MEISCPWSFLPPSVLDFCEANRCAWVVEPINSFSNIAFVLAGVYLWSEAKKDKVTGLLGSAGPIAILIGIFSAVLHATMTQFGNFLDLASMYLLGALMLQLNWRRYKIARRQKVSDRYEKTKYVAFVSTLMVIHGVWKESGVPLFGLLMAGFAILEIVLWKIQSRKVKYQWFWATVLTFFISLLIWSLDLTRTICWPESLFQGHALWHAGCALAIVFTYRHFRQFPSSLRDAPVR